MKLTLYHRTEVLRALIYRRLIHRTEPNRPHISSDISISNNVETKRNQMRPISLARLACSISVFSLAPRGRLARLAPRQCLLAPPVRGVLRLLTHTRNPFFQEKCKLLKKLSQVGILRPAPLRRAGHEPSKFRLLDTGSALTSFLRIGRTAGSACRNHQSEARHIAWVSLCDMESS